VKERMDGWMLFSKRVGFVYFLSFNIYLIMAKNCTSKLFGGKKNQKGTQKRKGKGKGKGTPWTRFVSKIYKEGKARNADYQLKDAMKEASKRKSEM